MFKEGNLPTAIPSVFSNRKTNNSLTTPKKDKKKTTTNNDFSHQSLGSILHRWKKNWFDLWLDGNFVYYQDESRRIIEDRIHIKFNSVGIKAGYECREAQPPETRDRGCLLIILLRDRSKLILCAESEDDAVAWKLALLETKLNPVYMYDPYDDNYQMVPLDGHNAMYVCPGYFGTPYGVSGMTHIVIPDNRYRSTPGEQVGLAMLAGAATGTALSSLFWLPCLF
nr:PREDICTED: pleckstrin homology domain-containing family B member 1 [Latimeria chalumnae]|eukprot:XP_014349341.1 PREDICTED: pleckstrin homology domain-containing family B member 1 [Latimeria chalumnae]